MDCNLIGRKYHIVTDMGSLNCLSILRGEQNASRNSNCTVPDLLREAFLNFSNQTALIYQKSGKCNKNDALTVSYKDLDFQSSQIAANIRYQLSKTTAQPSRFCDAIIAVCMQPSHCLIATLIAIWKCGFAYLPLSHSFPTNRIEHILTESEPLLVISDEFRIVSNYKFYTLDMLKDNNVMTNSILSKTNAESIALVLYTSGSTGVPKGVRLTHGNIMNRLQWQFNTIPYANNENVCIFKTALTFVDSVCEIWGPLIYGRQLLVVPKEVTQNPEQLFFLIYERKVQRMVLVPSLLQSLIVFIKIQNKIIELNNSLKIWICSGEILTQEIASDFLNLIVDESNISLYNFYGSTEVMGDVTYHKITKSDLKEYSSIPIGKPIDNCNIYLLDTYQKLVPKGNAGEIYVSGKNVTVGYIRNRDSNKFCKNLFLNNTDFEHHFYLYRTGDFGRISKNNVLIYEGRTDSQVKIRGHRVDLMEIQKLIKNSVQNIENVVVLLHEKKQEIFAFIKLQSEIPKKKIENEIKEILPAYMIPKIEIVTEIPYLINGKIDRQTLLNQMNTAGTKIEFDLQHFKGTPQFEIAQVLFETLSEVLSLQIKCLSPDLSFFNIGGNSLNSILTINILFEKGYYISIGNFLEAKSLGDIIEKIVARSDINNNDVNMVDDSIMKPFSNEFLNDKHKDRAIEIITSSFYNKADLERWLLPTLSEKDYILLMEALWGPLIEKNLSFAVFDNRKNNEMVGVALNFDIRDEPAVDIDSNLNIVFEFLEFLEGPIRDEKLSKDKGAVLHSFMMGTKHTLTANENIAIIQFMEQEVINLCKTRGFKTVFTTNTNPLTQQLGINVFNYKPLLDYQVNQYEANQQKPFGLAPDSQRAIVCCKKIT